MRTRGVERAYIAFQALFGLLAWLPVFYEAQKRAGLNDEQIFGIQSIYYVAFCLLEIPTGWLADRAGPRRCMRAGAAVLTAANLLPTLLPGYDGFLWHFLLIALSRSLISGASSAYLYDWLAAHGQAARFKDVEGLSRVWGLGAKVVTWGAAGWLLSVHAGLPYWISAVASAGAWAVALRLPSQRHRPAVGPEGPHAGEPAPRLREVAAALAGSPRLLWLMFQGVAVFVLGRIVQVNLFQPILNGRDLALEAQGLVMSAMTVFEAVGSARPGLFRSRLSDAGAVTASTCLMAAACVVMAWPAAGAPGAIGALCLFAWAMGLAYPVQKQVIHDAVPDPRMRATFLSVESIIDRASNAVVASVLAGYVSGGRVDSFLLGAAAFSVVSMALVAKGLRRYPRP